MIKKLRQWRANVMRVRYAVAILATVLIVCSTLRAQVEIGAELPLQDFESVDGWSGLPVMFGQSIPAGQSVDTVRYYADDDRAFEVEDGLFHFVPMIVQQLNGSSSGEGDFVVWDIGETHTPTEAGEHEINWGSPQIPDDECLYHPAALAWQEGFDDQNGGLISFTTGGEGIHFFNVATADLLPDDLGDVSAGLDLRSLPIHTSAAPSRLYQLNFETKAGGEERPGCDPPPPPPPPSETEIGAPLPLTDQASVDGWSGIPVMYGNQLTPGETVETVRYYPDDNREFDVEDELYSMVPLIVKQEDGSVEGGEGFFSVWEVGPAHVPTEGGEQEFSWSSSPIPEDGDLYHPAALQWFLDADDANGGLISFGEGGDGMHFFNVDTTDYIPGEDIGEVEADLDLSALQTHTSGAGGRLYQLNFEMSSGGEPGDFNNDGMLDSADINDLSDQVRNNGTGSEYDLNNDGSVDSADRTVWVNDLKNTWYGDADLDGEFNSTDFVVVFQGGLFETDSPAVWELGDWDGDGLFNSSDFVIAFQDGGFEMGARNAAANVVPEPSSVLLLAFGLLIGALMRRR